MNTSELPKRKKKAEKPKEENLPSHLQYKSTDKYINKVIFADSPYLEKGVKIMKRYLNPYYVNPESPLPVRLPPIKPSTSDSDKHDMQGTNLGGGQRSLSPYAQKTIPSLMKSSPMVSTSEAKYANIKSRYLSSTIPNSAFPTKIIHYYFEVGNFNNGSLVKKVIQTRSWWKERAQFKTFKAESNLGWGSGPINYDLLNRSREGRDPELLKMVNRFQHAYEINDKDNLFRNMWHHVGGDANKLLSLVPLTFSFRADEKDFYRDLQQFCKYFISLRDQIPIDKIEPKSQAKDPTGEPYDVYYDFTNYYEPGKEARDFKNLTPNEIPPCPTLFAGNNIWMLKPSGLNRGRGLELFTELSELDKFLRMFSEGYNVTEFANMEYNDTDEISPAMKAVLNKDKKRTQPLVYKNSDYKLTINNFVIQKYIEKPLLYKNHKFDIRVFVMMSHENELFVFEDAYVRLSSLPYDPHKKNYLIHLTNNAVQVRSGSYGSLIKGNIISIREFEEHLFQERRGTAQEGELKSGMFMEKIREMVKETFDATFHIMNATPRQYVFELFGYDFMIDENLKLWLIEVNSVPSLGESNAYNSKFMHRALDDMFKLTIDKLFPPPPYANLKQNSMFDLHPLPDNKNLWHFIHKY